MGEMRNSTSAIGSAPLVMLLAIMESHSEYKPGRWLAEIDQIQAYKPELVRSRNTNYLIWCHRQVKYFFRIRIRLFRLFRIRILLRFLHEFKFVFFQIHLWSGAARIRIGNDFFQVLVWTRPKVLDPTGSKSIHKTAPSNNGMSSLPFSSGS